MVLRLAAVPRVVRGIRRRAAVEGRRVRRHVQRQTVLPGVVDPDALRLEQLDGAAGPAGAAGHGTVPAGLPQPPQLTAPGLAGQMRAAKPPWLGTATLSEPDTA